MKNALLLLLQRLWLYGHFLVKPSMLMFYKTHQYVFNLFYLRFFEGLLMQELIFITWESQIFLFFYVP